jgi:hypothetical protein
VGAAPHRLLEVRRKSLGAGFFHGCPIKNDAPIVVKASLIQIK